MLYNYLSVHIEKQWLRRERESPTANVSLLRITREHTFYAETHLNKQA